MRYIKLFLLVLVFFLAMMFFAQNQASFAVRVPLQFQLMPSDLVNQPGPPSELSMPPRLYSQSQEEAEGRPLVSDVLPAKGLPVYAIMIACFTLGALLVLCMLLWDRLIIMGRLSSSRHKVKVLERKLAASEATLGKAEDARKQAEAKLQDELKDAEQRVNAALRAAGHPAQAAE